MYTSRYADALKRTQHHSCRILARGACLKCYYEKALEKPKLDGKKEAGDIQKCQYCIRKRKATEVVQIKGDETDN